MKWYAVERYACAFFFSLISTPSGLLEPTRAMRPGAAHQQQQQQRQRHDMQGEKAVQRGIGDAVVASNPLDQSRPMTGIAPNMLMITVAAQKDMLPTAARSP